LIPQNGFHFVPFTFGRRIFSLWAASEEAGDVSFADMGLGAVVAWSIFEPAMAAGIG
jgi:hypothetical protein